MSLPITSLLTGFLAIILVMLSMRVVAARRADSESEEGKKTVERRIRGQGNFVEYVPITLILFALLEVGGFNSLILGLIALVFAFARTIHGYAFSFTDHWSFGRFYGTLITFVVIGLLGAITMIIGLVSLFG